MKYTAAVLAVLTAFGMPVVAEAQAQPQPERREVKKAPKKEKAAKPDAKKAADKKPAPAKK